MGPASEKLGLKHCSECFHSLWVNSQKRDCWITGEFQSKLFQEPSQRFPWWLPYRWRTRASFSPQPLHHLLFLVFLITAIPAGVAWRLFVVLTCISLRASDVEGVVLLIYLLALCMPSLEKGLFRSSAHFLMIVFSIKLHEFLIHFGY